MGEAEEEWGPDLGSRGKALAAGVGAADEWEHKGPSSTDSAYSPGIQGEPTDQRNIGHPSCNHQLLQVQVSPIILSPVPSYSSKSRSV